jgi:hypothetical protein
MEKGLRERAIAFALNRTAEQAKTAATRDIASTYNLQAGYIRDRIKIRRAKARAQLLEVALETPGKRSGNLIQFAERKVTMAQARKRTKSGTHGVYVKVRRNGRYVLIPGAFIANDGRTVFRRIGKARLPIEALAAIDVPQAVFSSIGVRKLRKEIELRFPKRMAHELERLIRGYGPT